MEEHSIQNLAGGRSSLSVEVVCSICFEDLGNPHSLEARSFSNKLSDNNDADVVRYEDSAEKIESSSENEKNDNELTSLTCGHKFHKKCSESWLKENNTCPNCRKQVNPQRPHTTPVSRYISLSLVNNSSSSHWSERERENNVRVIHLDNGNIHLDFSRCPTANDNFIKPFILQYQEKVVRMDCPNSHITVMTVKNVYRNCPYIQSLDVSHCSSLAKRAITKLVDRCRLLKHLNVAYCRNVGDSCLAQIGGAPFGTTQGLQYLESLDLTDCEKVSDGGIYPLTKCRKLSTLRLAYCKRITDAGMSRVLPSLEMLKQLSVRGNSNLTNAFIRSLLNNAPFLERLDMVTCPRINGHTAASQLVRQKHSLNEFLSTQMILSGDGIQGLKNRLVPL
mmetsp:Transcript_29032/g.40092  ORF Transcript_29032/g.40092 Transcript_29032/m.40092 type:complete len:392 (+) Transcript_29032:105-1280(+)|eukprot:CAMPEP_0196572368 /NCGR_PEP_ID=MMETSP1081-20130531/2436_1 /TAXON_ID=36882 /ORGANISM="Pyramimonas amylifera, Strain CCMP720" /LENGTH=391 /DNA_ID=CAMNT_0041889673 /DNA_START=100 /DNA_END=1275 /DNA_ORIENTATION=+